jgi:hypothetical protein
MSRKTLTLIYLALSCVLAACDGGDSSTPTPQVLQPAPTTTSVGYPAPVDSTPLPGGYPLQEFPTPTLPEGYVAP